jgi:outer membrane usher protein
MLVSTALLCGLVGRALGQVPAATGTEQFEKIFGNRPPVLPRVISVPFLLDGQLRGDIQVMLSPTKEALKVDAAPVLQELAGRVRPDILEHLRAALDPQGQLSLPQLQALGLEADFDEQQLELRVAVPPAVRRASTIDLFSARPPPGAERALAPSAFSTYVNLRSGLDYVEQSPNGGGQGLQPFRMDFEGAVNLRNWVVEGNASFTQDAPNPWRRGDWRLVRDDPERRIRAALGDLAYPTTGLQNFQPLVGLTVARNFSLQPYRITQPRGRTSFFLQTPSKVEVLVNGQPVQSLQLPAGPHSVQDFLFASGSNEVVLRITDDVGRVEIIQLSFFFASRLLAAGEQEFAYSAGFPSRPGETGPAYDTRRPAFSLFHRVGLSDTFTAGLNVQGNAPQQLLGAESVWATPVGIFQPDVALSRVQGIGVGYAARLGYFYYGEPGTAGGTWALAVQHRSPAFAALGSLDPHNAVAWDLSVRYSRRLLWGMSGGVGGSYQISRGHNRNLSGVNLLLSKPFGRFGGADLTLERRDTLGGRTEHRAFLSVTVLLTDARQSFRTSHDTFSGTSRADWQYTAQNPVGGLDGNLGVQRRPHDYSVFGTARYNWSRADMSLSQDVTTPSTPTEHTDSRTSFRFATALLYADGQFAVSRPVQDSFAIVASHPDLKGQTIGVDPLRDTYTATIDRLGPAVLPNLGSYQVRNVIIDAPELPPGYELGPGVYLLRPTYRSGTVIRVGTGATVLLSGILETAEGTPVALQAGEIVSVSELPLQPIAFFTNRRGKFSLEGLRPGTYDMRLFSDPPSAVRFDIPQGKVGVYDIGTLRVSQTPAPQ